MRSSSATETTPAGSCTRLQSPFGRAGETRPSETWGRRASQPEAEAGPVRVGDLERAPVPQEAGGPSVHAVVAAGGRPTSPRPARPANGPGRGRVDPGRTGGRSPQGQLDRAGPGLGRRPVELVAILSEPEHGRGRERMVPFPVARSEERDEGVGLGDRRPKVVADCARGPTGGRSRWPPSTSARPGRARSDGRRARALPARRRSHSRAFPTSSRSRHAPLDGHATTFAGPLGPSPGRGGRGSRENASGSGPGAALEPGVARNAQLVA